MSAEHRDSVRPQKTLKRGARRTSNVRAPHARRAQIRQLFLRRADSYSLREAALIVGISVRALQREAEDDQREAYRTGDAWSFSWRQVAFIAMRRWTLAEIHGALRSEERRVG